MARKVKKCSECEYEHKWTTNRQGVGASAYTGTFSEDVITCKHPNVIPSGRNIMFTGETSPKSCPLK